MNILRVKVSHADAPGADTDIDEIMLASTAARRYPPLAAIIADPEFTRLEYAVGLMEFSVSVRDHDRPLSAHEALRLAVDMLDMLGEEGVEPWPQWAKDNSWLRRVLRETADRTAEQETERDGLEEELDRALANLEALVIEAMKLWRLAPNDKVPAVVDKTIEHMIAYLNEKRGSANWQTMNEEAVGILTELLGAAQQIQGVLKEEANVYLIGPGRVLERAEAWLQGQA